MKQYDVTTSFEGEDYVTVISENGICVFHNCEKIQQIDIDTKRITGATYVQGTLYFTQEGQNIMYMLCNLENELNFCELKEFTEVTLRKHVRGTKSSFALEVSRKDHTTDLLVYDLEKKKVQYSLPLKDSIADIAMVNEEVVVELGEQRNDVRRYADDYDMEFIKMTTFRLDKSSSDIEILDELKVYETEQEDSIVSGVLRVKDMRFPLFDQYLYHWLDTKSISSDGNYALYYSKDIQGIIVSKVENGDAAYIVSLPEEHSITSEGDYYFNDAKKILTVMENDTLYQFVINQDSKLIEAVNEEYNKLYKERKYPGKFSKLERCFYRALEHGNCELKKKIRL